VNSEDIATRIRNFLTEEFPNEAVELVDDTNLLEDWFVDSLGITEILLFLESSFDIRLTRADVNGENFKDIRSISVLVSRRLAK
jgi:acyl carrier protein